MSRGIFIRVVPVVLLALLLYWLATPPTALPARYSFQECRTVALTDRKTGQPIVGPEDIASVPGSGSILISAYDRLSPMDQSGGIYRTSVFQLQGSREISPRHLTGLEEEYTPFRPHGIAVNDAGQVAVINRSAPEAAIIEIALLTEDGLEREHRISSESLCRANDLAFSGGIGLAPRLAVSLDRRSCGFNPADFVPFLGTGSVVEIEPERLPRILKTGMHFPNGILVEDGQMTVSETRADRLDRITGTLRLPGGPDNLSRAPDGRIIAAIHPSLLHLAVYRFGGASAAPSRIVAIDPARPQNLEVLFDDPWGQIYSGATSAIIKDGVLIAGSVRESRLLVCSKG